jgi:hypothetical protein
MGELTVRGRTLPWRAGNMRLRHAVVVGACAFIALAACTSTGVDRPGPQPAQQGGPRFGEAPGWHQRANRRAATAATVPLPSGAAEDPNSVLESLPPHGVVMSVRIVSSLSRPAPTSGSMSSHFPPTDLPLHLSNADFRPMWEGQPEKRIPQYLSLARVRDQFVEVRTYFGSRRPPPHVLRKAQAQLRTLSVPGLS